MSIVYKCRHCRYEIGRLEQQVINTSMLGWDTLSAKDKKEMIHYQANGDVHIQSICENCEESLGRHPYYHELDFFIQ
ncbi:MAG TPA: anti-sigma-F factor Fin family protein [Bacillota bacterium]|nr:anti-sigma-F factor Fin family protein [Bacillota bacterium]